MTGRRTGSRRRARRRAPRSRSILVRSTRCRREPSSAWPRSRHAASRTRGSTTRWTRRWAASPPSSCSWALPRSSACLLVRRCPPSISAARGPRPRSPPCSRSWARAWPLRPSEALMSTDPAFEARLDALREEAGRTGVVRDRGIPIAGGPIPPAATAPVAYYGQPIVKPPVWTWQIGLYFFVGGTAGMSGVLALAGLLTGQPLAFVRAALALAFAGAVLSPILLIADLGRPTRFLNMLRVFKWRSAMSMGVWTLLLFSGFAASARLLTERSGLLTQLGVSPIAQRGLAFIFTIGTALFGVVLATYPGVLLGATAIPAWSAHHRLLPFHFGVVALGSAGATLELLGFRMAALNAIGLTVAEMRSEERRVGKECRSRWS